MKRTVIGIVGIAISVGLMPACISVQGAPGTTKVSIATGGAGGYYQDLCNAMRKRGAERSMDIECQPSGGSQDNIYQLDRGVDFAFVQSDVAHRAWRGEYPFEGPYAGSRLVTPLFTEKVHVLVRPHLYMTSLAQLKDKRLWLGGYNSGSRLSAFAVMQAAGVTIPHVLKQSVRTLNNQAAFTLLKSDDYDKGNPALDAVIDSQVPDPRLIFATLAAEGIQHREIPNGPHNTTILARQDLDLEDLSHLNGRKVRVGARCGKQQLELLEALGIAPERKVSAATGSDIEDLKAGRIDALVTPNNFPPALVAQIVAKDTKVLDLGPDPREKGKQELMVFLPADSKISSPAQLRDKKLWWPEGGGDLDRAITRFILGVTPKGNDPLSLKVHPTRDIDDKMAIALLRRSQLDAVFRVTVAPNASLQQVLNENTEIGLMEIDWQMVEKLVQDGSYVETSLQPSEYSALEHGVYTVGVQTLLLTSLKDDDSGVAKVRLISQLLHDEQDSIEKELGKSERDAQRRQAGANTDRLAAVPNVLTLLDSPVNRKLLKRAHQAALPYLRKTGIPRQSLIELSILLSIAIAACSVALFMEWGRRFAFYNPARVLLVVGSFMVWAAGAVWLRAVEGNVNQNFSCFNEAGLALGMNVIHHFGLPLEAPQATTHGGQFALEILSWLGVVLVGAFCIPFAKRMWTDYADPWLDRRRSQQVITLSSAPAVQSSSSHESMLKTTA
jgi:TRAP-type uncharacterized transport system substrate-binding protein